jgi:hypothetical protein
MNDAFLVAAFFDHPSLLAVRFRQSGEMSRVAAFSYTRRPDAVHGGLGRVGTTILVGMVVVGVVGVAGAVLAPSSPHNSSMGPMVTSRQAVDVDKSAAWKAGLMTLGDDLAPGAAMRPWYVRTLLDVPRDMAAHGDVTGGWLQPRCSAEDVLANRQAVQLAHLLLSGKGTDGLAVILDLPGPSAVAAAAGMATAFEPVITLNNIPHPAEVVRSSETLAAIAFWRPAFITAKASRTAHAPPVFVLEGDRMHPYGNEPSRFDNRSHAHLPTVESFKFLGVTNILYVRQKRGDVAEAYDLNALFVACDAADIDVRHLALESMSAPMPPPSAVASGMPPPTSPPPGNDDVSHWFWQNYGWGHPFGGTAFQAYDTDALYRSRLRTNPTYDSSGASRLDGGVSRRSEIFDRMFGSSSGFGSGGSWGRSVGSFFGSG